MSPPPSLDDIDGPSVKEQCETCECQFDGFTQRCTNITVFTSAGRQREAETAAPVEKISNFC